MVSCYICGGRVLRIVRRIMVLILMMVSGAEAATLRVDDSGGGKPVVDAMGSYSAISVDAENSTVEGFIALNATYGFCPFDICGGIFVHSNNIYNDHYGINFNRNRRCDFGDIIKLFEEI